MENFLITNRRYIQVDGVHYNEPPYDFNTNIASEIVSKPHSVLTVNLRIGKEAHDIHVARPTWSCYSGAYDIIIKKIPNESESLA